IRPTIDIVSERNDETVAAIVLDIEIDQLNHTLEEIQSAMNVADHIQSSVRDYHRLYLPDLTAHAGHPYPILYWPMYREHEKTRLTLSGRFCCYWAERR